MESWKRKLRMGMVGGGEGAFIGAVHRIAATYRRRDDFDESSSLDEEVARAREAGLPEDQVAFTAALVADAHGDLEEAAARLRPVAESDPRWREAFERYVRLGVIPQAVLDRLN